MCRAEFIVAYIGGMAHVTASIMALLGGVSRLLRSIFRIFALSKPKWYFLGNFRHTAEFTLPCRCRTPVYQYGAVARQGGIYRFLGRSHVWPGEDFIINGVILS